MLAAAGRVDVLHIAAHGVHEPDNPLGMTAALLHGGTGTVVVGVAQLSDVKASAVGPAHHAGLRRRLSPAAALSDAIMSAAGHPAPLVCFGAGW